MSNNWIPCSERLPEADVFILLVNAKDPTGEISVGSMTTKGTWYVEGWCDYFKATHWMPLPEKP